MCDKTYSILKDFVLQLVPNVPSEQMFIEDKDDTDMYFRFLIKESDEDAGLVQFNPIDEAHGEIMVIIKKGAGIRKTPPMRIGTYGKKSTIEGENTGLYVLFDILPIQSHGNIVYQTNIQFQIKGGE